MLTSPSSWRNLGAEWPRDTRDTLFLMAVVAWVVLLQIAHIPWWCGLMTLALLAWRATLALQARPLPGLAWRMGLLMLALLATWLSHKTLTGRDAGVTLIVVLLALKTLEMRARRDAFVVFFLSFFTLLTHFFYSQSLLTALGILLALLGLLTALVNAHLPVGRPPLAQSARLAAGMALMGAPIMLVLFLLFPRFAPLWGIPTDGMAGRSGLSGQMKVGDLASLALDDSIALRVRFEGRPPPSSELYFRGPVFGDFDGREWRPTREIFPPHLRAPTDLRLRGTPIRYEVTMEPHNRPWVFVLEAASRAPAVPRTEVFMTSELQWLARRPMTDLARYLAESHLSFSHGPLEPHLGLQEHVTLPPGFNPRTLELAQALRREHGPGPAGARAVVQAALDRLRQGGFAYTLTPGVFGTHTADEFWFDRKEGFCEHIASSFVVLMRAADIPSRVVTGYQGGEVNPVDGYWTVRQRDAHAWAEVWLRGEGWVRVDPTAAVAEWRLGSFQRLEAPVGAFAGVMRTLNPTFAAQARAVWEAVNNRWNQWVLNYTQSRQLDLLKRVGFDDPRWTDLAYLLVAAVVAVSLGGAAWALWEHRQHDPWLRLLQRARRRLERLGVSSSGQVTPRTLAQALRERPEHATWAPAVIEWLLNLETQRYARRPTPSLPQLKRAYRDLPWPRR